MRARAAAGVVGAETRVRLALTLLLLAGCETGPPLPPRAVTQSCQPMVGEAPVATLSETGCFTDLEALTPAPDLVPYGVRSPLWTDGAEKHRWVVVPPERQLTLRDGALVVPAGTILIKLFELAIDDAPTQPTRMEMRFLVLGADGGWRPFTYRFDGDGLEARLLDEGQDVEVQVNGAPVTYHFPEELTCVACHFSDRPVLGFAVDQLNFRFDYGPATENQLVAMEDVGLLVFEAPTEPLQALRAPVDEDARLEERARSWLHANCSHCHRPGGWAGSSGMDLRYEIPTEETGTCGERTRYYGLFGPDRIIPGNPTESGIMRRLTAEGLERMPPVGVSTADPTGVDVVRRWIASMTECAPAP